MERLVERKLRIEREERRLRDVAQPNVLRIEPGRDDLAHERLARDDADEPPVVLADEDGAHLGVLRKEQPRLLRARAVAEHRRLRHHRLAHDLLDGHSHG